MECLHCGLPAPAGASFCCPGCESVAGAIRGLGLEAYYRLRTAPGTAPLASPSKTPDFDDPLAWQHCVRELPGGLRECEVLVEGMRCAACAWLVEKALVQAAGVESAAVLYAARRARVRWREGETKLASVLAAIRAVGYAAAPYEQERLALVESKERRALLRRLWVAGLGMMQVMMYAYPAYVAAEGEIPRDAEALMGWAGLVLTTPVVAYSAAPFFLGAWRDLKARTLGMDVPVALGIASAFTASLAALVRGSGAVYFDSVTMFVFFLLGGRYLELEARARAGVSLQHLARLEPRNAERLLEADGHATETVPSARLRPGDRVLVRAGDGVPADGELESDALVTEAWLSGESRALARRRGEEVLGGSINAGQPFVLRVRRVGADTAIASIQRLMERALEERPAWTGTAQRASQVFVLAILAAAAVAGIVWAQADPARALGVAVAVLVITCPCALALAAPAALTVASGALARRGFVVTRAGAIERLAGATDIAFDKTGTLTEGQPKLVKVMVLGAVPEARCRALAASLARTSSHPLDRELALAATGPVPAAADCRNDPGAGIEGRIDGRTFRLGSAAFVGASRGQVSASVDVDTTMAWLADESGWLAAFHFGDVLRADAASAIATLAKAGLRTHVLSGDRPGVTRRIADQAGIARAEGWARPGRKLERVRELQADGARVAMVGDGINDAPVLAQADVSIAMGSGARLAQVRADAVLLSNSLPDLAAAVRIARRTRRVIRQNLAWALGYNAIAIPLAFAGLVTPVVAGIAMASSSLLVVLNALRLQR